MKNQDPAPIEQEEDQFKVYTSTIILKAKPMTKHEYFKSKGEEISQFNEDKDGYLVVQLFNSTCWLPKEEFDGNYKELTVLELELISSKRLK